MKTLTITKEVPVIASYDVVVSGGGPGGFMAALASARCGCKVAVIERYGFLGGMATAGLVAPISVFNYNGERIIDGLPWEFVQRMQEVGGAVEEKPLGNISFSPEKYKLIAQRMLLEAGVDLYFHSYITGVQMDGNKITHVVMENKNGAEALEARYVVDATGDADIAKMAGVPLQPRKGQLQPASLIFMMGGVDTDNLPMIHHSRQGVNYHDLAMREVLEKLRETENIPLFGGPWYCGIVAPGIVLVNMTRAFVDMTDNRKATAAECLLHENANFFADLLRKHIPQFKDSVLLATAPQTGVRETDRILGIHTLTGEEYINAQDFPDAVSRGCHPVDIHSPNTTKQVCQFLANAAFVPYRSLITQDFPNYIVASRCFSADGVASASIRVQASVMGLGQAAGAALGQCCKKNISVQEVDTDELRAQLVSWGANLGNK